MASLNYDSGISHYMRSARKKRRSLTREEEREIALEARAGNPEAIERLVEANLGFVVAVALQYRRYGLRLSELVAEGNLGLMMAVHKFDPDRGTRFVTYAGYWVRAYVLDFVVKSTTMVGAGAGPLRSKLFFRLRRERARVANLSQEPEERLQLMADSFDVTPRRMAEMLGRLDARDVSLDNTAFPDSSTTLLDNLTAEATGQEEDFLAHERKHLLEHELKDALRGLDRRERYIVQLRFMGDEEVSLAAIGRELGVSRERARQLEARAKRKLRARLAHLELDAVA